MSGANETNFCVTCGLGLRSDWTFCPQCGARRIELVTEESSGAPLEARRVAAPALQVEVKALEDDGHGDQAEALVRSALAVPGRDLQTLLIAADVLSRRFKINEASDLLNEALALSPTDYVMRIRRAEHFGRLGFDRQAMEELNVARRHLPASDIAALLHCQDLERIYRERSRSSFVTGGALPRLPSRLRGFRKKPASPSPESN